MVAARLSEKSSNQVVLLEAGTNYEPHQMPPEILEPYARRVFANPNYFWPGLTAQRVDLKSLNPAYEDRSFALSEIAFIHRIIWASQ